MNSRQEYQKEWYQKNKEKVLVQSKLYREKNKEKIKEYKKKYRKENKEKLKQYDLEMKLKVFIHYSGNPPVCVCCGEKEIKFLTLDHINGRQKGDRLGGHPLRHWIVRNNFPDGFQILCFNCNCAKGFFGECPHKEFQL